MCKIKIKMCFKHNKKTFTTWTRCEGELESKEVGLMMWVDAVLVDDEWWLEISGSETPFPFKRFAILEHQFNDFVSMVTRKYNYQLIDMRTNIVR